MRRLHCLFLGLVLVAICCQVSIAQPSGVRFRQPPPGFVPKHLQHLSPDERRAAIATERERTMQYRALGPREQQYEQMRYEVDEGADWGAAPPVGVSAEIFTGVSLDEEAALVASDTEEFGNANSATEDLGLEDFGTAEFETEGFTWEPACGCANCVSPTATSRGRGRAPCGGLVWSGRAEYLLWWMRGMSAPPLATTGPDGAVQAAAGVLPAATTLFGDDELNDDVQSGGRFTISRRINDIRSWDFTYLFLDEASQSFSGGAADFTILARPFFNVELDREDSRLIVFSGLVTGDYNIDVATKFQSAEAVLRKTMQRDGRTDVDLTFGYRFADLDEELTMVEATESLSGPTLGSNINLLDQFETSSQFHGGQIGLRMHKCPCRRWSLEVLGKAALGGTRGRADISGSTTTTTATGDVSTVAGGLLTQESNIGSFTDDETSWIGEFGVTLRRRMACGWTASVGYSVLYWSDVMRAGSLVDRNVNPTQIPPGTLDGEARPAPQVAFDGFWAQGIHLGLEHLF